MPARLQEIIAIPIDERYRRESFAIHTAKQAPGHVNPNQPLRFGIKGENNPDEFKPGLCYKFYGTWERNPQYGDTFSYGSFSPVMPHGKAGVISYLKQARNVGDAIAMMLWDEFAGDAVRVLRETPEQASEAVGPRFPIEKAKEAADDLEELKAAENITIELYDLFDGRGFGKSCVRQAIKIWGADAVRLLRHDPHKSQALRGVGWKKADAFYLALGKDPARLKRQCYCLAYSGLKEADQEGHVWTALENAITGLKASVAGATVTPEKALTLALRGRVVKVREDKDGRKWIADIRRANAEQYVAERLIDAMYTATIGPPIPEWEERVERVVTKPDHTRCARCHRKLTADTVAILNGQPFGPDCIEKVDFEGAAERMPLDEWLDGQATVQEIVIQQLVGATRVVNPVVWPSPDHEAFGEIGGKTPTEHQLEEYVKATSGPVGVLSGRPGTGKSFLLVRLVKALIALHGISQVKVMAPTGKAAQRVREVMVEAGVKGVEPTTVHRGLVVESSEDGWTFQHNERNPLPCKYLILEESSMLGLGLFKSVLAALAPGTGLLLVGDVNQLPPVEFGAPLRDMIAAGLPYGEFTQIHRNSGLIVKTCSAICDGLAWQPADKIDLQDEDPVNLCLIQASKHHAAAKVLQLVQQLKDLSPWDAVADVQIVVAVNKRSPLGRVDLNKRLQDLLNPGVGPKGCPFRLNDKVIQLKNGFFPSAMQKKPKIPREHYRKQMSVDEMMRVCDSLESGGEYSADMNLKYLVCNGEIGRVLWISDDGKRIVVKFPSPDRTVMLFRGVSKDDENGDEKDDKAETGCDLDLAYAVTCHKMQGSQSPIVIIAVDEYPGASGQYGVCDRAWLYTAISRAQKACFLVGQKWTADMICSKRFIWRRKTFLRELLVELAGKAGVELRTPHEPGGPSVESLFVGNENDRIPEEVLW